MILLAYAQKRGSFTANATLAIIDKKARKRLFQKYFLDDSDKIFVVRGLVENIHFAGDGSVVVTARIQKVVVI